MLGLREIRLEADRLREVADPGSPAGPRVVVASAGEHVDVEAAIRTRAVIPGVEVGRVGANRRIKVLPGAAAAVGEVPHIRSPAVDIRHREGRVEPDRLAVFSDAAFGSPSAA